MDKSSHDELRDQLEKEIKQLETEYIKRVGKLELLDELEKSKKKEKKDG